MTNVFNQKCNLSYSSIINVENRKMFPEIYIYLYMEHKLETGWAIEEPKRKILEVIKVRYRKKSKIKGVNRASGEVLDRIRNK